MYWEPIRLYSISNSKTPYQSSSADRQNESAKIVNDFLAFLYYFHGKGFSSKVCLFYYIFHSALECRIESPQNFSHRRNTRTLFQSDTKYRDIFSSAGFSVVCDEVCNDWTDYQSAGGVIQVWHHVPLNC